MKLCTLAVVVTLLHTCFVGLASGQKDGGLGSVTEPLSSKYRNDALGFEISIPSRWYVADSPELQALIENARKDLKTGYRLSNEAISHNTKVENVVFGISKQPLGTQKNSAFGFSVTKQPSDTITSRAVAEATKAVVLKDANNSLLKDISVRKINGLEFATFDFDVASNLGKQHLRIFIVNARAHSVSFALTYWDDPADLELMTKAVESFQLSPK